MNVKVSEKIIETLVSTIADESYGEYYRDGKMELYEPFRYLTGEELVDFFNILGYRDTYSGGLPGNISRKQYTKQKLIELNEEGKIKDVCEKFFAPINYIDQEYCLLEKISQLNKYFFYDDLHLKINGKKCVLEPIYTEIVRCNKLQKITHESIQEHIDKCEEKIINSDFSGAITNARSLIESVLLYINSCFAQKNNENHNEYSGNLPRLYKKVSNYLNLKNSNSLNEPIKQTLTGLVSIISGLSALRNNGSDSHGKGERSKKYKLERHHAILVVNSAKTFSEFVYSSFERQTKDSSLMLEVNPSSSQTLK